MNDVHCVHTSVTLEIDFVKIESNTNNMNYLLGPSDYVANFILFGGFRGNR